ncbi:hypothetical protein PVAND_017292 [Polypedilum vanderplanki]|uniref:Metalloendopeptidase n=1 Tax=Polypedilum vanderplanki TaxID=319348 RepID=A0A9J6BHV5_POLVA|nr:hypothetical protein PVAND_017292 [Polypedilum vanderplanki]
MLCRKILFKLIGRHEFYKLLKIFLLIAVVLIARCQAKSKYCVNSFCSNVSDEDDEDDEEEENESEGDEEEEETDEDESEEDEEAQKRLANKYRNGRLEPSQYEDFFDVELDDDFSSDEFNDENNDLRGGTGILDKSKRWTKKGTKIIVPYNLDTSSLANTQKSKIKAAMHEIESKTCIKFNLRNFEENYITFRSMPGKDCSSVVGMHGGQQFINLDKNSNCGKIKGTIMHEILHALGFHHMHTHSQRDRYITFYDKNIFNFFNNRNYFLNDAKKVSNFNTKYDFFSIMHYPPHLAGKRIIKPKKKYLSYEQFMGQRKELSEGDIERINNMYSCSDIGSAKRIKSSDVRPNPNRQIIKNQQEDRGIYFEKKEHTIFHQYTSNQNHGPLRKFPFNDENEEDEEEENSDEDESEEEKEESEEEEEEEETESDEE